MVWFDLLVHCYCVTELLTFDEVDLINFITPCLAATPLCVQENSNKSCDKILQILTSKINSCKYFKVVAPKTNFSFSYSFILVHLNISSLYKHFDSLCLLERPTFASRVPLFLLGNFPTNECEVSDFCL